MKSAGHSSIAMWIALCVALCAAVVVEISMTAHFRSSAVRLNSSARSIEAKICRLGPLAADTKSLKECEASFEDDSEGDDFDVDIDDPLMSAKLKMEIAHAFAEGGMDEKTARDRAADISRCKGMIEIVGKIFSSKQFVIRRVVSRSKDGADDWKLDVSCDVSVCPTLLATLGYPPSGLKLCGLRICKENDGAIVAQSRFAAREREGEE